MRTVLELGVQEEGEWRAGLLAPRAWRVSRGRCSRRVRCTAPHHQWLEPSRTAVLTGGAGHRAGRQPVKQSKVFLCVWGREKPEHAAQGEAVERGDCERVIDEATF